MLTSNVLRKLQTSWFDHTLINFDSGPLDYRLAETWETMPATQQWWYAFTKVVGPSPTLAPGVLGLSATLLLLASLLDSRPSENYSG